MMEKSVDDVLQEAISLHYRQPYKVNGAIYELRLYFTNYKVNKFDYAYDVDDNNYDDDDDEEHPEELLLISIDLPVIGLGKGVPLSIWLPRDFPMIPPTVHLRKSETMFVNPAGHVGENNIISHSYLDNWTEASTLTDMLQSLLIDFTEVFPAFDLRQFRDVRSALNNIESVLRQFPQLKLSWKTSHMDSLVLEGPLQVTAQSSVTVHVTMRPDFPIESADVHVTYANRTSARYRTENPQTSLLDLLRRIVKDSTKSKPPQPVLQNAQPPVPAPRRHYSKVPEEVRKFIQSADLSEATETELIKRGFTSLRAILCLEDGDIDKLELCLADICLLKKHLREMRSHDGPLCSNVKETTVKEDTRSVGQIPPDAFCRGVRNYLKPIILTDQQLILGEELGRGKSGVVYRAILRPTDGDYDPKIVAVKTIKVSDNIKERDVEDIIGEILQMYTLKHKNVLELKAVTLIRDIPHLVLPFMANGDLLSYVQSKGKTLPLRELVKLTLDIAQGMEYLSARKIVHCDLAARNCLVDADGTAKVGDFGLSRQLHLSDYVRVSDMALAPRWLAPEVLQEKKYTIKSDVWSFGIVLWEVMTLGQSPYGDIKNIEDIPRYLFRGGRLVCPDYIPINTRKLMLSCWEKEADKRPKFSDIVSTLAMELSDGIVQPSTGPGMESQNIPYIQ